MKCRNYDELKASGEIADFGGAVDFPQQVKQRLDFATLHNEIIPMKGIEQISFQINRSYDMPGPLVEGLVKLWDKAQDIGMAVQATREAKLDTVSPAPPLRAKPVFNPKPGM